jgi:hypothetical protein
MRAKAIALVAWLQFSTAAGADVTKSGPEFQVNAETSGYQRDADVAATADGGFVVVWIEANVEGESDVNVVGQRIGASSAPVGDEFLVNLNTTDRQNKPAVAADADGNFVVVWVSRDRDGDGYGIFGQRFSAAAEPRGTEFQVNTYTTDAQRRPAIATWEDGRFIVVWESTDQDGADGGIFGQRYDANGVEVASEFSVNTYTSNSQYIPRVDVVADDAFVVVWGSTGQDAPGATFDAGVFGRRFNDDGTPIGTEFQANTYTTDTQSNATVVGRADGGFTVVWEDFEQDSSGHGIFAQRYNDLGARLGTEFQLDAEPSGDQYRPTACAAPDSGFIAVWHDDTKDGSGTGLFARAFDKNGSPAGAEFQVNTSTEDDQFDPRIDAHDDGDALAIWRTSATDFGDIFAQRLSSSTTPTGTCGDPAGSSLRAEPLNRQRVALHPGVLPRAITASDALAVLRTAVGSQTCELCVCDVDGSGAVSATDALITLKVAVGQSIALHCPACD